MCIPSNQTRWEREPPFCACTGLKLVTEIVTAVKVFVQNGEQPNWKGCRAVEHFHRAEFDIQVTDQVADEFLNGRSGYRGHYFNSVQCGEMYNQIVMSQIAGCFANAANEALQHSLRHGKIWGAQESISTDREFVCERWRPENWDENFDFFKNDVERAGLDSSCIGKSLQDIGPFVFNDNTLTIKGAFVDSQGDVHVTPDKMTRSYQIHNFGAS